MARQPRIEYPGAIYHVMNRGDRQDTIFPSDVDRQDFLTILALACQKTDIQVHAYCLMSTHFHLVIETPLGNLVDGMRWLLSTYTSRVNHRHKQFGHLFSGRYKALVVDDSESQYLKTVCDYVHLNPARANLLGSDDQLLSYPWSSLNWYLAAPKHRPGWMRTDRLLGAHGIRVDNAAGRRQFEERMEKRRRAEEEDQEWTPLHRAWCFGTEEFRQMLLEKVAGQLGEHHAGEVKRESAEAKAERIIAEELRKLRWTNADLSLRLKGDPSKLKIAVRLRCETTMTVRWIAERLSMGTWKSATTRLHQMRSQNVSTKC